MRSYIGMVLALLLCIFTLTGTGYGITISLGGSYYLIPAAGGTAPPPPGPEVPPTTEPEVPPPTEPETTLGSLEVEADSPPPEGLFVGQVLQYHATAILSDDSRIDVTELVTWYSSNQSIASISNQSPTKGQATGIAAGQTFIAAVDPSNGTSSSPVALVIQEQQVVTCNTVAEINSNTSCIGSTVTLQGHLTERLDSDNYTFYDGTGSVKIEYEGDIPLYVPIEITGQVDGDEIEVSSYRVL